MKIVFLDIDGVLNATDDWLEIHYFGQPSNEGVRVLSRSKLALLAHIIHETGAKIVISSTWRKFNTLDELSDLFGRMTDGWFRREMFYGMTPSSERGFRGDEVDVWLANHPEVTKYIILDDDGDFHQHHRPYFVNTETYVGLTHPLMERAINLLN